MYLRKFKLKEEYRGIKPYTIEFKAGLNLIVGDNGCGKSTMLELMFANATNDENEEEKRVKEIVLTDFCRCHGCDVKMFDTEKQNPRLKASLDGSADPMWDIAARFMSHGETIFPMVDATKSMKNTIIFIDEPEAGISLANQKILSNSLLEAVKNKCQLIVATHSYVLIKNALEVFDLEAREWVNSTEYLKKFNNE